MQDTVAMPESIALAAVPGEPAALADAQQEQWNEQEGGAAVQA